MTDYKREPLEVHEETMWIVYDPWVAQDVAMFTSLEDADAFKEFWESRNG